MPQMIFDGNSITIIEDNTERVVNELKTGIARAMAKIGATAESDVKEYMNNASPKPIVDTGRLRNSITNQLSDDGKSVVVGTNVEYAQYVELGARGRNPRPYLRNTITNNQQKYADILKQELS